MCFVDFAKKFCTHIKPCDCAEKDYGATAFPHKKTCASVTSMDALWEKWKEEYKEEYAKWTGCDYAAVCGCDED
jgi:hypothetical protein